MTFTPPSSLGPFRWVRQEDRCGCGIACLAMITGQSYHEVKSAWPTDWDFQEDGILIDDAMQYLGDRGIPYDRRYRFALGRNRVGRQQLREGWPQVFAPIHIISVNGSRHDVVLLADGTVFDPMSEQSRHLVDCGEVSVMLGAWPNHELRIVSRDSP